MSSFRDKFKLFKRSKSTLQDRRSQPSPPSNDIEPLRSPKSSNTENGSLMAALANELKSKQLENEKAAEQQNFVTVIEVNETANQSEEHSSSTRVEPEEVPEMPPSPPPTTEKKKVVSVEVVPISLSSKAASPSPTDKVNRDRTLSDNENSFTGNDSIEKGNNSNPPTSPLGLSDVKKKVPPRPPPKYGRRIEPPTIPPSLSGGTKSKENSLERNIKPSDILRNKSATSIEDSKAYLLNRNTSPDVSKLVKMNEKHYPMASDNFTQKTSSLEKSGSLKSNQSGSLGKTSRVGTDSPTGSLGKSSSVNKEYSPTGSIDNKSKSSRKYSDDAGSKESLISQGNISEIIKSYNSMSSLSSEGTKGINYADNEPYYDTVAVENNDGEYVYITNTGNRSTSSRDDLSSTGGSTLPMPSTPSNHSSSTRSHMSSQSSVIEPESPGRVTSYANIDYFLQHSNSEGKETDDDGGPPLLMRTISTNDENDPQTPSALRKSLLSNALASGNTRGAKIRAILSSIIKSETSYVECLNKMIQYKKAIYCTLKTSQPVIKPEDANTIFFKIEELYATHTEFLRDLREKSQMEVGDIMVGDVFKRLASSMNLYNVFLHNYGQAIDTVKKCSDNSKIFKETVSTIVLNLKNEQSLTLEDLLHKPVARVQINALVFSDLLNVTPQNHPDHSALRQAQKTIHNFLKQFNVVNQRLPTDSDKTLRRMVKHSFIVELVDGHRKLRHLFLFNDAIACAKYKPSGRDRFEIELKWFIPIKDITAGDEDSTDLKDPNINIMQLKSQACTVRDQILLDEKEKDERKTSIMRTGGSSSTDKHRRKLADLEAQLVLASPNLLFKIINKHTNKSFIFFLSSEFERTQWIESICSLQTSIIPGISSANYLDIQAFIMAMQNRIKTEMGSYLMRNLSDESLLVGDLHLTIQGLTGLDQPADLYICVEVDSYGHYFRKAKTKMVCQSTCPQWNESFVLELEGSQNIRILLYQAAEPRATLKAKQILKLSRSWLKESPAPQPIKLTDSICLDTTIRFVPGEITLRRVPTAKPGALFGAKMANVLKREKRDIPFIITACVREVERRGMSEVGVYRVSGSASDLSRLKKTFETNVYEAEQLLKEVDIHSVTGILKSYLRELPEALFTDFLYPKFVLRFHEVTSSEVARTAAIMEVFQELPIPNQAAILHILDHLIRVNKQEADNKMSLHNLAMVFGPTLLRPSQNQAKQKDLLESSTVDVMAQAGILYCCLFSRSNKK
ncbi:ABR family protein [Megaselia abdita]